MEKLAVRSKINYDFLGHVERGESSINVDLLASVAKALEVELWKLVYPDAPKEYPLKK
jgi:transcriptional regulator with XRE-family HTH domain